MNLLLIIGLAMFNAQATSEISSCVSNKKEMESWFSKDKRPESQSFAGDDYVKGLRMLSHMYYPTSDEVTKSRQLMEQDFPAGYSNFLKNKVSCPQNRWILCRALINTAVKNPKIKPEVAASVKASFETTKYPLVLEVMVDSLIAEYALKHDLWPSDPKISEKVTQLHSDLVREMQAWNKKYLRIIGDKDLSGDEGLSEEKLRKFKDLSKLKEAAQSEMEIATRYDGRLKALLKPSN